MSIDRLQGVPVPGVPGGAPVPLEGRPVQRPPQSPVGAPFEQVLKQQQGGQAETAGGIKFSAHAQQRLVSRNIKLGEADLKRISDALDRAQKKGAREALLVTKDLALIVSVPHRTVITAVDGSSMRENVFTNIDSAVIL